MATAWSTREDKKKKKNVLYFVWDCRRGEDYNTYDEKSGLVVEDVGYTVHALDLSSSSEVHHQPPPLPEPILRLPAATFPSMMGFGAVGSSLYMVGGQKGEQLPDPEGHYPPYVIRKKYTASDKVFAFDTSLLGEPEPPSSGDYREYVAEVARLHSPKENPFVIPLKGGKICVMGSSLFTRECRQSVITNYPSTKAFIEIMAPEQDSTIWHPFDAPPSLCREIDLMMGERVVSRVEGFQIAGYTLMEAELFIYLKEFRQDWVFIFNTEDGVWRELQGGGIPPHISIFSGGIVLDGALFQTRVVKGKMRVLLGDDDSSIENIEIPGLGKYTNCDCEVPETRNSLIMQYDGSSIRNNNNISLLSLSWLEKGTRRATFKVDRLHIRRRAAGASSSDDTDSSPLTKRQRRQQGEDDDDDQEIKAAAASVSSNFICSSEEVMVFMKKRHGYFPVRIPYSFII